MVVSFGCVNFYFYIWGVLRFYIRHVFANLVLPIFCIEFLFFRYREVVYLSRYRSIKILRFARLFLFLFAWIRHVREPIMFCPRHQLYVESITALISFTYCPWANDTSTLFFNIWNLHVVVGTQELYIFTEYVAYMCLRNPNTHRYMEVHTPYAAHMREDQIMLVKPPSTKSYFH